MKIHVHVGIIVLHRLPVSPLGASAVGSAIEAELARLVEISEQRLNDRGRALDAALRWLAVDPASHQALGETERLAERLGQWRETAARLLTVDLARAWSNVEFAARTGRWWQMPGLTSRSLPARPRICRASTSGQGAFRSRLATTRFRPAAAGTR